MASLRFFTRFLRPRLSLRNLLLTLLVFFFSLVAVGHAQQCSKTELCETGCCSKHGFCGITSEHCGEGCQSTCDYKPPETECDKDRLCERGCCSEHGFCGESAMHCGEGCQSTCDWAPPETECDANKSCAQGCCSKFGHCGYGKDCKCLRPKMTKRRLYTVLTLISSQFAVQTHALMTVIARPTVIPVLLDQTMSSLRSVP